MRRIALLIGNSSGLEGVKKDLYDWRNFLLSTSGGAWAQDEIKILMNPSKVVLLDFIGGIRKKNDFAIVIYSGHGGYNRETVLEINENEETVTETDLLNIAPKQISVFDCCRGLVTNLDCLNERQMYFAKGGILPNLQVVRERYEERIKQAIDQQICLYACGIGETALDTEAGALYIQELVSKAKEFPNNREFNTVEEVHGIASLCTRISAMKRGHTQNPAADIPKCLSSQKIILSINPSRV